MRDPRILACQAGFHHLAPLLQDLAGTLEPDLEVLSDVLRHLGLNEPASTARAAPGVAASQPIDRNTVLKW
jgi:hypothetical protein